MHAERERHRDHGRQTLGDRGDGEGDGRHRRRDQVITTHQPGHEHQADHHGGDERETLTQRIELDLQGCRGLGGLSKQPGQAPHFGVHAGCDHHGFDATPGDHGVHEHHADTFGEGCAAIHRPGGLADRMGLAGQRRLGHFGPMRLQHPGIGRHAIARFEQQDIARHELFGRNDAGFAITAYPRAWRQHAAQGGQRVLRTALLEESQGRIEKNDHGNDRRILDVADQSGEQRCADQDADQHAPELVEKLEPCGARGLLRKAIRTMALQSDSNLRLQQAGIGGDLKLATDGLVGYRMPGNHGGARVRVQVRLHRNNKGSVPEGHRPLHVVAARTLPTGKVSLVTDTLVTPGTGKWSFDQTSVMTMPGRVKLLPLMRSSVSGSIAKSTEASRSSARILNGGVIRFVEEHCARLPFEHPSNQQRTTEPGNRSAPVDQVGSGIPVHTEDEE